MKANCVVCGREFEKRGNAKTCGKGCSKARKREHNCESSRRRYAANPEQQCEYNRRWRKANPEKVRESGRRRRAANPDKKREYNRRYYAANPEKQREWDRRWREANTEKFRERLRRYRARRFAISFLSQAGINPLIHAMDQIQIRYTVNPQPQESRA